MTNNTSPSQRTSALRRTLAGIAAAVTIAVGGVGMISAPDAAAAGVKTNTYVVQSSTVQVQSQAAPGGTRGRE